MSDPIVLVSVARTPMGSMMGSLSGLAAHELGAIVIKADVERAGIDGKAVDEVIMGNVLQAGQGQAPARQAALGAGLPLGVGCTNIHKVRSEESRVGKEGSRTCRSRLSPYQ